MPTPLEERRFDAAIFDLDGTLLDTLSDIADAANAALAERHLPVHDTECYRYFAGDGAETLARRALPIECRDDSGLVKAVSNSYRHHYETNTMPKAKPFDGILEMLASLDSSGIAFSIVSNKPAELAAKCVSQYFPGINFATIISADAIIPIKPDPAGALKAISIMKTTSSRCIFVGDSDVDVKTALASKTFPVGVLWGFRGKGELISAGAELTVRSPVEICRLFSR